MKSPRSHSAKSTASPSFPKSQQILGNAEQDSLDFEGSPAPGSFNDELLVRAAISASIRRCGSSRQQIAEEMTELLGVKVTVSMLNDYSASSKRPARFPLGWERAFCRAVRSEELMVAVAEAAGCRLICRKEIELLELGREYLRQKRASQQVEILEKHTGGGPVSEKPRSIEQQAKVGSAFLADDDARIRTALASSIRQSSKSREQIANLMSALLGVRVTAKMLNTYSAHSMEANRLPAAWILAFCLTVGDFSLLRGIVKHSGFRMVGPEEERQIALGKAWQQKLRAEKVLNGGGK